jgi:hypothetical protein
MLRATPPPPPPPQSNWRLSILLQHWANVSVYGNSSPPAVLISSAAARALCTTFTSAYIGLNCCRCHTQQQSQLKSSQPSIEVGSSWSSAGWPYCLLASVHCCLQVQGIAAGAQLTPQQQLALQLQLPLTQSVRLPPSQPEPRVLMQQIKVGCCFLCCASLWWYLLPGTSVVVGRARL